MLTSPPSDLWTGVVNIPRRGSPLPSMHVCCLYRTNEYRQKEVRLSTWGTEILRPYYGQNIDLEILTVPTLASVFTQQRHVYGSTESTYCNVINSRRQLFRYYRGADKSLARPTSRYILFDSENISFDASLVIQYINSTNIPPIMIINRIYENQNILSLQLFSFMVGLRIYQHPCTLCVQRHKTFRSRFLSN